MIIFIKSELKSRDVVLVEFVVNDSFCLWIGSVSKIWLTFFSAVLMYAWLYLDFGASGTSCGFSEIS